MRPILEIAGGIDTSTALCCASPAPAAHRRNRLRGRGDRRHPVPDLDD
jgi:hypothetical protein